MKENLTRRGFLGASGAAALSGTSLAATGNIQRADKRIKILGIGCSPRTESSTADAVQACLEAAQKVAPEKIEIELIKLAGLNINGAVAAGVALPEGEQDDFLKLVPQLSDPAVAGMIIGSPVYFSNMSSLCKAFLERLMVFRQDNFKLSNVVTGVLAVGGARSGGQELTITSIHNSLFNQEMIVVGESRPTAHFGPGIWNNRDFEKITDDEVGMAATRNLGKRVAEVALTMAQANT
jgi:multimeric flavodoxin WrbA